MSALKPYPLYPKSDPRFYLSPNGIKGSPVIFFVHFYGGHQRVMKRHIQLVNDLGYDAFCFNMPAFKDLKFSYFFKKGFGAKHLYADMIRFFLDQLPGQKIMFAFSNPCASAIEAISTRNDTQGLVCDSGPSGAFLRSAWNLSLRTKDQPFLLFLFAGLWSPKLHNDVPSDLEKLRKGFPILSIQGGQDKIIPPWHIEKIFNHFKESLAITSVILPEASHLDALKRFPDDYRQSLSQWLTQITSN